MQSKGVDRGNQVVGYQYIFKYIIVGESSVGKSCLLLQFIDNRFKDSHDLTIGVDFGSKTIQLNDNTNVKVQIWDTAGQERYRSLAPMYYRGAAAAIIVYDITNPDSFAGAKSWVKELQRRGDQNVVIALVSS